VDDALIERTLAEELAAIRTEVGAERFEQGRFAEAASIYLRMIANDELDEFLTLVAYDRI
jgi:malate synthase